MLIKQYGLILRRLEESDLEMVRTHRNRPDIQKNMLYRKHITAQEQKEWFQQINNKHNFYFVIEREGIPVGLINGRDIDYEKKTSEGGIFLWGTKEQIDDVAFLSSVIILEMTFPLMQLNRTYAKVKKDNRSQQKYNAFFGFKVLEDLEDREFVLLELTREDYLKKRKLLLKYAEMISGKPSDLSWEKINISPEDRQFAKKQGWI